jgi:RHS repeat-associated protein
MARVRGVLAVLVICLGMSCRVVPPVSGPDPSPRPRARLAPGELPAYAPSEPWGNFSGNFAADPTGAATFALPIVVPPGTAGVQPSLALTYNSHGENGYAGTGWQLTGLSAIGRCNATYELDGYKAGIDFGPRDRFCLDGNRLVAVSGEYGAPGTVYHTARETQTSVISNGTCGDGPCSFTAYNRNGDRLSFGGTADSRVAAQGRTDGAVRTWAVDRIVDLNGNYTTVAYSNDAATGEYVPLHVDYTGNEVTGLAPQRRVAFAYEPRSDVIRRYLGGSLVQVTKRLRSIATSVSGETVQTYTIDYETSSFTQRSRPKSVTVCDSQAVCLPPVTLGWQTEDGDFAAASSTLPGPLYVTVNGRSQPLGILQDLDGDGIADYSVATEFIGGSASKELAVWRGQPDGTFVPAGFSLPGPVFRASSTSVVMSGVLQDIDGDGILDYSPATYNASTGQSDLSVYLGTRTGFTKASFTLPDAVYWLVSGQTQQTGILTDIDGDGIPDYSRATRMTSSGQELLAIWKGTGSGFTSTGKSLPGPVFAIGSSTARRIGVLQDINGDGIADYSPATVNGSTGARDLEVWVGQTPGFTFAHEFDLPGQLLWMVNGQTLDSGLLVDLNGDGIPDYSRATESAGTRYLDVYLGTGAGYVDSGFDLPGPVFLISSGRAEIDGVATALNGDGTSRYSRATKLPDGTTDLSVWLGSGEGFRRASFSMPEPLFEVVNQQVFAKGIYEDVNGDGLTDFANTACVMTQPGVFTNCSLGVRLAKGPFSDLLTSVTGGFGGTTSVEYMPISNPAVYTRGGAAAYPLRDGQSSMYVMSRHVESDARGASYGFSYRYSGARVDVRGRGWLGFTTMTSTEEAEGRESETTYSMTSPFYGLVTATEIRTADGKALESTATAYEDFAPSAHQALGIHQPWQVTYTDTLYEDGAPAYTRSRHYDYDAFGNMTMQAQSGDAATNVLPLYTCTRYLNDPAADRNRLGYRLQMKAVRTEEACRAFLDATSADAIAWAPATDLRWSKITYDSRLNVLSESDWQDTHSAFLTLAYTVDPYGNTLTVTNANGATTTYTWDATFHSFLETVTTPPLTNGSGGTYTLTGSQVTEPRFGVLVQSTTPNGAVMQQEVDGFGRAVSVWGPDPDGNLVQLLWSRWKNDGTNYFETRSRPSWTSPADPAAWYWQRQRFDGLARPYREEANGLKNGQAATIVRETFYDAAARPYRQAENYYEGDAAPIVTTRYDALNRPTLITNPSGVKQHIAYRDGGLRITSTLAYETPEATTSIQLLDVEGRPRQQVAANGQSTSYGYDPLGQLVSMTSAPQSRPATLAYDSMGNVRTITRSDTGTTTIGYDTSDRLRTITDASGNSIVVDTYDALDRAVKRTSRYGGQSSAWTFTYDETAYRNGLANLTSVMVEAPVLGVATYHYGWDDYGEGLAGSLTLDGATYHWATLTDPLGRPVEEIEPDGSVVATRYGADEHASAIAVTDPGAASARTWATLTNYTAAGQLQDLTIEENGVSVARRYYPDDVAYGKLRSIDARSTRQNDRSLVSLTYAWNVLDQVTGITDHNEPAQSQTFGYRNQPLNEGMGFLTSATGGYGAKTFRYEELGNVTQRDATTFTYVPGRDQVASGSDGVTWEFSPNGFLRARTGSADRQEYTFDADGKLVGIASSPLASGPATTILQAAYDHTGRKVVEKTANGTTVRNVTGTYEVTTLPGGAVQHTRTISGPFGPLAAVTGSGTGAAGLDGAAQRNRVRALLAGETLAARATGAWFTLLSVALAPLAQRLAGMTLLALLAAALIVSIVRMTRTPTGYARTSPLFARIAPFVAVCVLGAATLPAYGDLSPGANGAGIPTPGRVFFVQNLIGSTVSATGDDGSETARVAYEPYGLVDQASSSGTDNFRAKFSGKAFDPASGLYDFTARRFDPLLGRFISPDPQMQYVSPYLYAGSDPASMIDPDGEFAFLAAIAIGAVVGAYFGAVSVTGSFNPLDWDWSSGATWAGLIGGAAIGAVGAAAGGLVVQAGIAVGSLGGTAAQVAGVAIGIAGEAAVGAVENAAFTALAGGSAENVARAAVTGAFVGAVFGGASQTASLTMRNATSASPKRAPMGDVGPDRRRGDEASGGSTCSCGCASFVAGTPVATAGGELRPIESVVQGDSIAGREPLRQTASSGAVAQLLRRESRELVRITLATGERITTTPEHPFYVDRSGWVSATHLGEGDSLATAHATPVRVAAVERWQTSTPVPVYNFVIPGTESYYVGVAGVLVHNGKKSTCSGSYDPATGVYKEKWSKDQLKLKFPNKPDRTIIKKQIRDKNAKQNLLIPTFNPQTSVANPAKLWSRRAATIIFKATFGQKTKLPGGIRATLGAVYPNAPGNLDVDEIIPRIHGGLTGAQGHLANQQPLDSTINSIAGAVAGNIAKKHPGMPITRYEIEFVD